MYSRVSNTGRYKSQFTVKTKGQRLIFNALGITEEGLDSDDGKTEKLLSWDGSATTCANFSVRMLMNTKNEKSKNSIN